MLIAGLIRFAIPAGAGLLLACSDYPAEPSETPDLARAGGGAPGTYVMSLLRTGEGIVLQGKVSYAASGLPATGGEVKFFVCKAQGGYAPASACQNGSGRWSPAFNTWVGIIPSGPWAGYARALFDDCPPGVTMGFYFQYRGLRTGVADGKSAPVDYTEPL
jgi:hypothetical protein